MRIKSVQTLQCYADNMDAGMMAGQGGLSISPYVMNRDPGSVCDVPSAAFYKAGKAVEALKGSIKSRWGNWE